jgi:Lon protease-like protein
MNLTERIPLFPLGVVLLPEMMLPLHIFEERYKKMINECLEEDKEFGIVYYDGSDIKSTGCTATITKVNRRYSDGRMDIMTRGYHRFNINEVYEENEYMEADVTFLEDFDLDELEISPTLLDKAQELIENIVKFTKRSSSALSPDISDPTKLSFIIAGIDAFSFEEKQGFLEMDSTAERLEKGVEALEQIIERIKINTEIRKIIGGNGHLPELLK